MKNIAIALLVSVFIVPVSALAEESAARPKTEAAKGSGEVNTKPIVIVGRRQKPRVSVMVSRAEPRLSVTQTDVRLLQRIDSAVTKAPF